MSETILNQIIETEREAVRIEEDSKKEARELIAKARQDAATILEKSRTESEALRAEILRRARQIWRRRQKPGRSCGGDCSAAFAQC